MELYGTQKGGGAKMVCACIHKSKLCSVCEQGAVDLGKRATFSVQRFHLLVDDP